MTDNKSGRELVEAVLTNDYKKVQSLLHTGSGVDTKDEEHEETALMLACHFADLRIVKLLLEHGADVNARDNRGYNALFFAVGRHMRRKQSDAVQVIDLLDDYGIDARAKDLNGRTVLMYAIPLAPTNLALISRLLHLGVDPKSEDDDGNTAMDICDEYGFVGILGLLQNP